MSGAVLETINFDGRSYRHAKAYDLKWSIYYGEDGGGFGSISWKEKRKIGRDYADLAYLYDVKVRVGLQTVLFHGRIVAIEESTSDDSQTLAITAVGYSSLFRDNPYNHVYRESRYSEWKDAQTVSGSFRPDKFDVSLQSGIRFEPRKGMDYEQNEYTRARYTFPFGETPQRVTLDYDLTMVADWPGKFEVRDDVGILASVSTSQSASLVLTPSSGATYIELRFYVTLAGENTAEDDTVYVEATNVKVSSESTSTVTIKTILDDLVAHLVDQGLSSDVSQIQSIGRDLPATVAFTSDQVPTDIIKWAAQFKGASGEPLAWGVELNDQARVYLEAQDLTTIKYYVRRSSGVSAQVRGDFAKSAQKAYVTYRDENGDIQRTSDQVDADRISDYGGYFRREAVNVSETLDATTADALAAIALADRKLPEVTTSFTVTDHVFSATGKKVPVEQIQPGGIVIVADFRAREAIQSDDDYRTQWSSFQLVGVEVDLDRKSARLIPAGDRDAFQQILTHMQGYGA
jgi:hypothetical protein